MTFLEAAQACKNGKAHAMRPVGTVDDKDVIEYDDYKEVLVDCYGKRFCYPTMDTIFSDAWELVQWNSKLRMWTILE